LTALVKANAPQWVWIYFPLWIACIILGLDGRSPEWGTLVLFFVTLTIFGAIAQFSNTYADRDEDWLYGPTNPLVTGELKVGLARRAFILQNIIAGVLLVALLLLTLNYALILAMMVGWFVGLSYSVPPFRFKETLFHPIIFALGLALFPIVAWLIVAPLNDFIIAFAIFFFVWSFGFGITQKFRKTHLALDAGLIQMKQGGSIYDLNTVGFKLKVRNAMIIEAVMFLGSFALVPIFWHLQFFDSVFSIALLAIVLPLTIMGLILRIKDPIENSPRCNKRLGLAWIFIILILFAVSVSSLIHWSLAILACLVFLIGFPLLVRVIHPWGCKGLGGQ
jgi:4-hydroxybenzoate polyprenyltransferase